MAEIQFKEITKRYPDGFEAVKAIDLDIGDGEFMILVGPSGCGKSTALRMIAGLEDITSGDLIIGGERVNDLAPRDRDIAMVFQNYALYPHMTVRDNMGFALKLAKTDKGDDRPEGRRRGQDPRSRAASGAQAGQPVRWSASAGGDGPGDRARSEGVLDGRAAVEPGRQAARADAHRGRADPAHAGHDDGLRHARSDRGDDPRRPGRGHARGDHPAGRHARRPLRGPAQPVRRRLHRLTLDELPSRPARGRHRQAPVRRCAAAGQAALEPAARGRPGRPRRHRRRAARALRGRCRRGRRACGPHEVPHQGRRRGVDGLGDLRVLRRQGRARGLRRADRAGRRLGHGGPAHPRRRASRSSRGCRPRARPARAARSSSRSTPARSSCSRPTPAAA